MRRSRASIAREVGIEGGRVATLALELADRLLEHRFPTPRVLGIDDIKMNKKSYTIFVDSERGHAIGLIESIRRIDIENWILRNLDTNAIDVVVSDLAATIIEAVAFALPGAIHVVDRWHVLQAGQRAMSVVIRQTLAPLKAKGKALTEQGVKDAVNGPRNAAATIQNFRKALLGRVTYNPVDQVNLFNERELQPVLAKYQRISRAFWARIDLSQIYHAPDESTAVQQLAKFYKAAAHPTIATEMKQVLQRIRDNERLILNYFTAHARFPDVPVAALTTSSTENRNGKLRRAWKAGRGVRNYSYLRMLALYEPWRLDRDILLCAGTKGGIRCKNVEGPVALIPGLIGQDPTQPPRTAASWRCQSCCAAVANADQDEQANGGQR